MSHVAAKRLFRWLAEKFPIILQKHAAFFRSSKFAHVPAVVFQLNSPALAEGQKARKVWTRTHFSFSSFVRSFVHIRSEPHVWGKRKREKGEKKEEQARVRKNGNVQKCPSEFGCNKHTFRLSASASSSASSSSSSSASDLVADASQSEKRVSNTNELLCAERSLRNTRKQSNVRQLVTTTGVTRYTLSLRFQIVL